MYLLINFVVITCLDLLLDSDNFFPERYPVAMASCVVDISHEVTNKV